MSTITIHTENENQINLLKALLEELKINFEINKEENLTEWQKDKILKGISDISEGKFSSSESVGDKARKCLG
jgi:predicted transcriptional regulator